MIKSNPNEQNIISAIKTGHLTTETIVEKTKLPINVVRLILGSLCKQYLVRRNPNDSTFTLVDQSNIRDKVICYGDLLQPVKFYTNKTDQRYAIRGTWNPIGADITDSDIEWIDDTTNKQPINKTLAVKGTTKPTKSPGKKPKDTTPEPDDESVRQSKPVNPNEPVERDRSDMFLPTITYTEPTPLQKWEYLPQVKSIPTGEFKAVYENYTMNLTLGASRGGTTLVSGTLSYLVGKHDLKGHPTIKKGLMVDSDKILKFLKGGTSPFSITDFIIDNAKEVYMFPISIEVFENGSTRADLLSFGFKDKSLENLSWTVIRHIKEKDKKSSALTITTGKGNLQKAITEQKITSFIKALKNLKISK